MKIRITRKGDVFYASKRVFFLWFSEQEEHNDANFPKEFYCSLDAIGYMNRKYQNNPLEIVKEYTI